MLYIIELEILQILPHIISHKTFPLSCNFDISINIKVTIISCSDILWNNYSMRKHTVRYWKSHVLAYFASLILYPSPQMAPKWRRIPYALREFP